MHPTNTTPSTRTMSTSLRRVTTLALATALVLALALPALAQDTSSEADTFREMIHLQQAFRAAADTIAPAVVQIYVERTDPPRPPNASQTYYTRPDAPASGVVIDPEGYVITSSWNLAGDVESIRVTLADGRRFEAERLGFDEVRDLALLKIDATDLTAAEMVDADALRVGQFALVVGRSVSVEHHTLTTGIVSAVGRHRGTAFQLDARINYGSSGGAVIDLHGRLIGIACRVVDRSNQGQNSGVGYATSTGVIQRYLPDYRASKTFTTPKSPFLGIQADQSAMDVDGVRIAQVIVGTGAADAGLAEGDVITEFGGTTIQDFDQLVGAIRGVKVGDKIKVKFRRGAEEREIEVTIGERPAGR